MAQDTKISNTTALSLCNLIADLLDAGGNLRIYSGTVPTAGDAALSGNTVLIDFSLPTPTFGAAADLDPGARATANPITGVNASATGTATFFRALTSGGATVLQGTVGTSDADLIIGSVSVTSGQPVTITSWTLTVPEG